ncbi:hypothetical protein M440DRAFT_1392078 [Trichoderma longibrachiatum ATCC 18648]|uniref:Uncharacterized protein n=1 Tax=Trichoderma longibrachiatum ATCC 18648 TaxID=983965 RepID=A0A2T4C1T1_TRILO|nr:hypothetical protein M440DRAFT_1392078 [Trichoderma longibrachiatum ATCC 18648]
MEYISESMEELRVRTDMEQPRQTEDGRDGAQGKRTGYSFVEVRGGSRPSWRHLRAFYEDAIVAFLRITYFIIRVPIVQVPWADIDVTWIEGRQRNLSISSHLPSSSLDLGLRQPRTYIFSPSAAVRTEAATVRYLIIVFQTPSYIFGLPRATRMTGQAGYGH